MDEELVTNDLIHLRPDHTEEAGAQVDPATNVAAASVAFNNASLPPNMPEWQRAAIRAEAAEIVRSMQDDELRIIDSKQREQDAQDAQSSQIQILADHLERERQEWMQTKSTVAGVTMTGQQWADLSKRLRDDDDLRERILDVFMKRGMSQEEAERRYERVADVTEIAAKPPSQRTEEENERFEKASADPEFATDLSVAQTVMNEATPAPVALGSEYKTDANSPSGAVAALSLSKPNSALAPAALDF